MSPLSPKSPRGFGGDGDEGAGPLLHLLAGIDAPKILLLHITVEAGAGDAAPFSIAAAQRRHDAGRELGDGRCVIAGGEQQRLLFPGCDEGGAAARQQRMQHPTLDALGVANLAPDFEFGGDLDRQARPLIDPQRLVFLARPFVQVHAVGFEADEARQRQFADRPELRLLRARLSR